MRIAFIVLALCSLAFSVNANPAPEYWLEIDISQNNKELVSPKLLIQPKAKARISQNDRYSMDVFLTQLEGDTVLLAIDLELDGHTSSPSLVVRVGEPSILSYQDLVLRVLVVGYDRFSTQLKT